MATVYNPLNSDGRSRTSTVKCLISQNSSLTCLEWESRWVEFMPKIGQTKEQVMDVLTSHIKNWKHVCVSEYHVATPDHMESQVIEVTQTPIAGLECDTYEKGADFLLWGRVSDAATMVLDSPIRGHIEVAEDGTVVRFTRFFVESNQYSDQLMIVPSAAVREMKGRYGGGKLGHKKALLFTLNPKDYQRCMGEPLNPKDESFEKEHSITPREMRIATAVYQEEVESLAAQLGITNLQIWTSDGSGHMPVPICVTGKWTRPTANPKTNLEIPRMFAEEISSDLAEFPGTTAATIAIHDDRNPVNSHSAYALRSDECDEAFIPSKIGLFIAEYIHRYFFAELVAR